MLALISTDQNGFYQASGVVPQGGQGFTVVAHSPSNFSVTVNLTLPVSVIKGAVTFAGGVTPVAFPQVFVTEVDSNNVMHTFFPNHTDATGNYTVFGAALGTFTVDAQDSAAGLNGTNTGSVTDITIPVTVNVSVQPSGTLMGTIFNSDNTPAPLARVPLGDFSVQGSDASFASFASASGTLVNDGETITLNLTLPATGTATGKVFQSDGTTPGSERPSLG